MAFREGPIMSADPKSKVRARKLEAAIRVAVSGLWDVAHGTCSDCNADGCLAHRKAKLVGILNGLKDVL